MLAQKAIISASYFSFSHERITEVSSPPEYAKTIFIAANKEGNKSQKQWVSLVLSLRNRAVMKKAWKSLSKPLQVEPLPRSVCSLGGQLVRVRLLQAGRLFLNRAEVIA